MDMPPRLEPRAEPPPRAARVNVLAACHDYAVATWGNVFVNIWRHETSLGAANSVRAACDRFGAEHPRGVLLLTVIHETAPAPPPAARNAIAEWLKNGHYIRASAVVMEGQSFRAAFVRGVVTGLTLLARQPFPHQVCSIDAAGLLFEKESQRARLPFDRGSFASAIRELRAQVEKQVRAEPGAR
jgi:hypothetical protein